MHPGARLSSQRELQQTPLLRSIDFKKVLKKELTPPYKPPEDHLNCDPSLELEEMIVETKPLHKKKKRLAKQRSAQKDTTTADTKTNENYNFIKEFIVYNRYKELKRKAMELKEKEWQEELNALMASSQVNNLTSIQEVTTEHCVTSTNNNSTTNITTTTVVSKIDGKLAQALASTSDPFLVPSTSAIIHTTKTETKEVKKIEYIDSVPSTNKAA